MITGRVQGVGFRAFTRDAAAELGVSGWVKNCEDGSVELVAEGDVDALVARLREGPMLARVDEIRRVSSSEHTEPGFSIRR